MEGQLTAGAAGYIALDGDAPGQLLLQRSGCGGVLVVEHRHLIPCCRKGAGSGRADAPVAAGDQHPAHRSRCGRDRLFFYRLRRRLFGLRRRRRLWLCGLFQRDHPGGLVHRRHCRFFQRHDAGGFVHHRHHRHRRLCSRCGKGLRRALFLRHLKGQFKLVLVQECIPPVRYSRPGAVRPAGKTLFPSPDSASFRSYVRQRSGALACLPVLTMGFDKIPLNNIPQSSPKRKWELQFFTQFPLFFLIFPCFRAPGASSGVCPPAFPAGKQKTPAKAAVPRPPAAPFPPPDGG